MTNEYLFVGSVKKALCPVVVCFLSAYSEMALITKLCAANVDVPIATSLRISFIASLPDFY